MTLDIDGHEIITHPDFSQLWAGLRGDARPVDVLVDWYQGGGDTVDPLELLSCLRVTCKSSLLTDERGAIADNIIDNAINRIEAIDWIAQLVGPQRPGRKVTDGFSELAAVRPGDVVRFDYGGENFRATIIYGEDWVVVAHVHGGNPITYAGRLPSNTAFGQIPPEFVTHIVRAKTKAERVTWLRGARYYAYAELIRAYGRVDENDYIAVLNRSSKITDAEDHVRMTDDALRDLGEEIPEPEQEPEPEG